MPQLQEGQNSKLSKKELSKRDRMCWVPGCPHRAWLIDWAGWHWCFKHIYGRGTHWNDRICWNAVKRIKITFK
ncbi:MAG: hypothetical protein WCH62_06335 [Candidatus Omnitrophota bacterium]